MGRGCRLFRVSPDTGGRRRKWLPLPYATPTPVAKPLVYSVGPDGVDDAGQGDEITSASP